MRTTHLTLLTTFVILIVLFMGASPAKAQSMDAVNDNKRVVVNVKSKDLLAFHFAAGYWNRFYYRSGGKGPAFMWARTTKQPTTLRVRDFHDCSNPAGAHYDYGEEVRVIRINRCHMDKQPFRVRMVTIGHELGHALDFEHTPTTRHYWRNSIMYPTNLQPSPIPRAHDWKMYEKRWVR